MLAAADALRVIFGDFPRGGLERVFDPGSAGILEYFSCALIDCRLFLLKIN